MFLALVGVFCRMLIFKEYTICTLFTKQENGRKKKSVWRQWAYGDVLFALLGPNCRTMSAHTHVVFHGALTGQWEADSVSKGQKASFKSLAPLVSGTVLNCHICWCVKTETLPLNTEILQGFGVCTIRKAVIISTMWHNPFFNVTLGVWGCLVAFTPKPELH